MSTVLWANVLVNGIVQSEAMDEFDLPDGMESTNDYMALHGVWMDLPDVLAFAKSHQVDAAKFNFSLVQ